MLVSHSVSLVSFIGLNVVKVVAGKTCSGLILVAGLCTPSACDGLSTCIISGTGLGVCVCIDFGTFCEGDCSGDLQTLTNGTQSCNGETTLIVVY